MTTPANIDQLIIRMENYLECWKQFNSFMNMARAKDFRPEDESQFLEIKSVLTQELEYLISNVDCRSVTRDDVHMLLTAGPSLRFLGEMSDNSLRNLENNWHRIYIGLQSILGQLKVKQQETQGKSLMKSWFKR
jgi:hypothetical protein